MVDYVIRRMQLTNDDGRDVPSLEVTCPCCGARAVRYGRRGRSVRQCLAAVRRECGKRKCKPDKLHTTNENTGNKDDA